MSIVHAIQTSPAERVDSRTILRISVGLAIVGFFISWYVGTPTHVWGDDFAIYLLQAKALSAGNIASEIARNSQMIALSDATVGPPAASWGLPVVLRLTAPLVGWDIQSLKLVGYASVGVLAAALFSLARRYVSVLLSLAVTAFVVLQPPILASADDIGTNVPGLALDVLGLLFVEKFAREDRPSIWHLAVAALITLAAYSIRSNGALLAPAFFVALTAPALTATGSARTSRIRSAVVLTLLTSIAVVLYHLALPDGSLAHTSYLSFAPASLIRRADEVFSSCAEYLPISLARRAGVLNRWTASLLGALLVVSAARGAWLHRRHSLGLVIYALLNLVLILLFREDGGVRYTFPVFVAASILTVSALTHTTQPRGRTLAYSLFALSFAVLPVTAIRSHALRVFGPSTPASDSLFAFVRDHVPAEAPVAFFKPRALRYFTGRVGVVITDTAHLARVRFVVLNTPRPNDRYRIERQVSEQSLLRAANPAFRLVYASSDFRVYSSDP